MENKELERELLNLPEPAESDVSMAEQMKNKKAYEKQVDTLCIESEQCIKESKYEDALLKLIKAYKIVLEHPWVIKQSQIYDLIQIAQNKHKDYLKNENLKLLHQKEKEKNELMQKELEESHKRDLERQKKEKEQKIKHIQELKHKEEEISNQAFKLLDEGQSFLKNHQYDKLIAKYNEAKALFLQIKWNGEAKKIEESIQDFTKQKQVFLQKQEKEKKLLKEKELEWKEKEHQLSQEIHKSDPEVDAIKNKKLQQTKSRKDIENQIYKKLDEAVASEKSGNLNNAIRINNEAIKLMERLGWKQEISKLNNSIETLQNKLRAQEEIHKREQLSKQLKKQEEEELQRKIKEQKEEQEKLASEKQRKLQDREERKKYEQATSEKAFRQIEEIEKQVKYYKEHAKIDKFTIECPYLRAEEIYENSRDLFLSIGWKGEADKLTSAISMYEENYKQDLRERVIYNKRREKELADQKSLEESVRLQKEEQERTKKDRKEKLLAQSRRKAQTSEIGKKALKEIENIEKVVKNYKENAITNNYQIECPFLQARDVYRESQELLLSIGWKEEADKLESSISMYENLHLNDQKERATLLLKSKKEEIEQKQLEETIRLQRIEREKEEQARIQKLQAQGKKKQYEKQISKRAFARIEEIEKEVKYYKDHAIAENYSLDCPYLHAKEIYQTSRTDLLGIGWKKEADKLQTSISLYEDLYQRDQLERKKLVLIKQKQLEDEKELEKSIRLQKEEKEREEQEKLKQLQELGKKKEYEEQISKHAFARIEDIEKEVKYYKDHAITENYVLDCPYLRAKEIYQTSRMDLLSIGWKKEADKLQTSISMYENLYKKDQLDRERIELVKQKQIEDEKELEKSIRLQKEEKEREEQEKLKQLQEQDKKKAFEDEVSKRAFQKIEEIEKEVKFYKEHAVSEQYNMECPYLQAKNIYESSREELLSIGWREEADKLRNSISMYEKLARNDVEEREKFIKRLKKEEDEKQKLEESIRLQEEEQEKQERERLRLLREQNKQKQHEEEISEDAFHEIEEIEKEAAYYKERVKIESYNLPCPYSRAKEVYQHARELLLSIGWKKEADKLSNSISMYSKLEKEDIKTRENFRKRQEKEREKEQELQETIRRERERLSNEEKERQSEQAQKDQKRKENEELQQVAYTKLEEGNTFIQEKDFEKATDRLNEALKVFKKIKWKNGVRLTEDAIKYKENEREKFEKLLRHERLALQEQNKKEREFQDFIEEQRRIKEQEEQNRKLELLRMDMETKQVSEKQENAFKKLEEGNDLVKIREFKKANNLYVEALNIFKETGWIDGVEKTKEALSHNLLEQERYKQQLELQKKQEKEKDKEERELKELIKQRQALTQLEEEQKRLKFDQQHEEAEKINLQQQEASSLLEQGNAMTTQQNFDEADALFKQALRIFNEIKWDHGIKITTEVIKHNAEERKRYGQITLRKEKVRQEQIQQHKELEKMLVDQKLLTEQETQLKQLKQQQESDKLSQIQSMQDKAMKLLEEGNREISKRNFDKARSLFSVAMKIFQDMGWKKGIEMVNDAIDYNERELVKFNNEKLREEQKKKEAVSRQHEINELIQESKEEEVKKQLEWKQKLEEKTRRLDDENQVKDQIFALLEKGSKLSAKNEFIAAIDLYKKTIPLFGKISWSLKRDQVIDLIDQTQQDYENYRAHLDKEEKLRKKQIQEEEELKALIESEQQKEKARLKVVQQQQFQQMEQDKRKEELRQQASDEINKAVVMLERRKFDSALDSLHIALKNFNKLGWEKEAQSVEEQIEVVQHQKREAYKPIDREKSASDMEVSENGYYQIDEADKLIRQKRYRDALPFLEAAKQLFEKIQWKKAMKMVEIRIRNTERLVKEKDELIEKLRARRSRKTEKEAYRLLEKVDKFRRENHYDYALTSAKEAQKIFQDLNWEREANELIPLIETITKEIEEQNQAREKDQSVRDVKIKLEEEEEQKIQEIIEERRRRRREARQKLMED